MTAPEIRPATDDQVRAWHDLAATGLMIVPTTIVDSLVARIESDRAAAQERDRQIAAQAEEIERLKKREAGLEDALRQFRKVLGPFATKSALALLDAALDAALKPEPTA